MLDVWLAGRLGAAVPLDLPHLSPMLPPAQLPPAAESQSVQPAAQPQDQTPGSGACWSRFRQRVLIGAIVSPDAGQSLPGHAAAGLLIDAEVSYGASYLRPSGAYLTMPLAAHFS